MFCATLLLVTPTLAVVRRGKPEAVCDSTRLLNEFTDCHLPCDVHSKGNAEGSHCTTNFCGTDGVCCRQGVTAGACTGAIGCNGWHCCVCHPSGTSGPTDAPAVQILGDPFTSYQGQRTQFFMPPAEVVPLINCGNIELLGRAVNSNVKGDDQQWFDMFKVSVNSEAILSIAARRGAVSGEVSQTDEAAVDVELDNKRVSAALAAARLVKDSATVRSLTTLDIQLQGKEMNTTGSRQVSGATVAVSQDVSKSIGSGFVEIVQFTTNTFGMKIQSSVAGKFANSADRVRNLHVDVAFTNIDAQQCAGMLPEIWGVKQMSKATAKLLVPPKPVV